MIVEFLAEARSELIQAVEYYEGELAGLGHRFWDEVDQHIMWIAENLEVPQLRNGSYRRINLRVFPYYIADHLGSLDATNGRPNATSGLEDSTRCADTDLISES